MVVRPTRHEIGHFGDVSPKPDSWPGIEKKLNLTQQKHAFANQMKRITKQNQHKNTEARLSLLLRHPAWKRSGSVLNGKDKKGGDK